MQLVRWGGTVRLGEGERSEVGSLEELKVLALEGGFA